MSDVVTTATLHALMRMIAGSESDQHELTVHIRSFVVWSCEHRDVVAPWVWGGECGGIVSLDMMFIYVDSWSLHTDDLRTGIAPPLVCEDHCCKCTTGDLVVFCEHCHEYCCESCGYGCACDQH